MSHPTEVGAAARTMMSRVEAGARAVLELGAGRGLRGGRVTYTNCTCSALWGFAYLHIHVNA